MPLGRASWAQFSSNITDGTSFLLRLGPTNPVVKFAFAPGVTEASGTVEMESAGTVEMDVD